MLHRLTLNSPWYEHVRNGDKEYEGRCYWKSIASFKVGDVIEFSHHAKPKKDSYRAEIIGVHRFPTFELALKALPLEKVLPGIESVAEGVEIYKSLVSIKTQQENGVGMLQLKRL